MFLYSTYNLSVTFIICAGTALSVVVLARSSSYAIRIFLCCLFSDLAFLALLKACVCKCMGVVCLIALACTGMYMYSSRYQLNLGFSSWSVSVALSNL